MATTRLSMLMLKDKWPGAVNPKQGIPVDGWDGTSHSDVTAPVYPPGEKISAYTDNSNNPGWYTMYYATLAEASDTAHCISADISDGLGWVAHTCLTEDVSDVAGADPTYTSAYWNAEVQPQFVVSTCISVALATKDVSGCGPVGLPCCSVDHYGWFWVWVGGVCPCKDVTFLDDVSAKHTGADMTTLGAVAGAVWLCQTGGTAMLTSQDWSSTIDVTVPHSPNDCMGYVLMSDA